jgi:hypothetical protein
VTPRQHVHPVVKRAVLLSGWLICTALLAGWLVAAIHRGHLAGVLIVATGLVALVVVPLLSARLNRRPRP